MHPATASHGQPEQVSRGDSVCDHLNLSRLLSISMPTGLMKSHLEAARRALHDDGCSGEIIIFFVLLLLLLLSGSFLLHNRLSVERSGIHLDGVLDPAACRGSLQLGNCQVSRIEWRQGELQFQQRESGTNSKIAFLGLHCPSLDTASTLTHMAKWDGRRQAAVQRERLTRHAIGSTSLDFSTCSSPRAYQTFERGVVQGSLRIYIRRRATPTGKRSRHISMVLGAS